MILFSMGRKSRYYCLLIWLAAFPFIFNGCPGSSAPPAAPAELPPYLYFPDSVDIDFSSLQGTDDPSLFKALADGEFADEIALGPTLAEETDAVTQEDLGFLSQLEIPSSTDTTQFTGEATLDGSVNEIKIDFADFSLDGDGENEDCSGHTAAVPICFRVWFDDERTMAGRFDAVNSDGVGIAGRFRVIEEGADVDFLGHVIYDHEDSENKSTENFTIDQSVTVSSDGNPEQFDLFHSLATQVGGDAEAKKILKVSDQGRGALFDFPDENSLTIYDFRYAGAFLEGSDFWLGSLDDTIDDEEFSDLCAQISTGERAEPQSECSALGLVDTDIIFVDFTEAGDVAFPDTTIFPTDPGF